MVKFSCSEAKMLIEATQRVLCRAIAQERGEFILWRNRCKLPGLTYEGGQ